MRPIRLLSIRRGLIVAAACGAAFAVLSSAAADEISARRTVRPITGSVSEWAWFDPDHGTTSLNGDLQTIVRLSRSWRREGGELLWFRSGGREYVVRDPEVMSRARRIMRDQRELDPEIKAVANRMKAIEAREARLERDEERLEDELERIDNERDAIRDRRGRSERDQERLAQLRRDADALRERTAALSPQRKAIDDELAQASREEQAIDRRQDELEKRSDAAMSRLCLEAYAAGLGQPFRR